MSLFFSDKAHTRMGKDRKVFVGTYGMMLDEEVAHSCPIYLLEL